MALFKIRAQHFRRAAFVALLGVIAMLIWFRQSSNEVSLFAAADGNNPPTNVSCRGFERDTVRIYWQDNDNDEADYRIERSIDGAAFTELATVTADAEGKYDFYADTGIDTTKNYRYQVRARHADNTYTSYGPICNNRRIYETSNVANDGFRIFYGLEGTSDNCPPVDGNDSCLTNTSSGGNNVFVLLQHTAMEGAADGFLRVGFDRDASTGFTGVDKIPVNVVWCDSGGCAGGGGLGLSPLLMETAFDLVTRVGDPVAYLVGEHETFHFQQGKYGGLVDPGWKWVIEGQARSSQDKICIGNNRAAAEAAGLCFDDVTTGWAGYVPQVNSYLKNTNTPVNQSSYSAALFWTYVTEKFGTFNTSDQVEGGMNLMVQFWKESAANPGRDGIAILNSALQTLGTSMRFRDIWKDFAVANYAKNITGSGVQDKYKYEDMAEPGGNYDPVTFAFNQPLALGVPFLKLGETVHQWGANYYRFTPAANVPLLDIRVNQDSNTPVYYTVMALDNNNVVHEFNTESRHLNHTLLNNGYDEVVVIVVGLDNLANYRISVNGTQPSLLILSPTTTNKARVGNINAPEKFRVAVQVVASDGTPLSGVDLDKYNFRIGTRDVPDDNILTSAHVQDQQWFILRAVTQTLAGQYDLHVNYDNSATLAATQTLAINYVPRTDADNMLIIDDSGSMAGAKLDAAKNAAKLYVDSWREGDMIGVIGFDSTPTKAMELKDWTSSGTDTRAEAIAAINGLVADGGTNIGDSVMMGWDELTSDGDPSHDWALVLLSDGVEEASAPTVPFPDAIKAINESSAKKPVIHAVAIGPNADGPLMQKAANDTGGTYQFVSAPSSLAIANLDPSSLATAAGLDAPFSVMVLDNARLDLDSRYRFIATEILGQQQTFLFVGPRNDGNELFDSVTIPVEGSVAELVVSISFDGGCGCLISLHDPDDDVEPPHEGSSRHLVWRVASPEQGDWHLILEVEPPGAASDTAPQATQDFNPYVVQAAVKSDVILDVAFTTPISDRVSGVPMPIVASLTDVGPITNSLVVATIVKPDGSDVSMLLRDNGLSGDGEAGDGIYANTFYQTGASGTNSGAGSYNVTVTALGTSSLAGTFLRQKLLGFFIFSSGDSDSDGLPDEYEETHCVTNNTCLDPDADPDNDGIPTGQEFPNGTDPLDPDSDDGGGSDGSEEDNNTNPHDPADDNIEPTWTVAYPGVSKVFVRYAPREEYIRVEISRSIGITGPYTLQLVDLTGGGMMTDTEVVNDNPLPYCYFAVGVDADGNRSTPLPPSCATPKADPWSPEGGFLINEGAASTLSTDVRLTIFASDAVSPHNIDDPFEEVMLPPSDSATEVTEMRISNNGDMSGAAFEPYDTFKEWTLGTSSGLATVYMQFRDAAGNLSEIVANSIWVGEGQGPGLNRSLNMPFVSRAGTN